VVADGQGSEAKARVERAFAVERDGRSLVGADGGLGGVLMGLGGVVVREGGVLVSLGGVLVSGFIVAGLVVVGGFVVSLCGVLVVLGGLAMCFVCHVNLLYIRGRRSESDPRLRDVSSA
jgi:hypothetical protein